MIKAKDMNQAQITHTFCTFCNHRIFVAGHDYWGCSLEEKKKEETCSYRQAILKEASKAS